MDGVGEEEHGTIDYPKSVSLYASSHISKMKEDTENMPSMPDNHYRFRPPSFPRNKDY
jgi:hypothetical protein